MAKKRKKNQNAAIFAGLIVILSVAGFFGGRSLGWWGATIYDDSDRSGITEAVAIKDDTYIPPTPEDPEPELEPAPNDPKIAPYVPPPPNDPVVEDDDPEDPNANGMETSDEPVQYVDADVESPPETEPTESESSQWIAGVNNWVLIVVGAVVLLGGGMILTQSQKKR